MTFLWRLWRMRPRLILAIILLVYATASQPGWAVTVESVGLLQAQHALYALSFTFEQLRLQLEAPLLGRALVQEHVVVARLPARYLAGPRDLEPLCRRLVCFQFWHASAFLSVAVWD